VVNLSAERITLAYFLQNMRLDDVNIIVGSYDRRVVCTEALLELTAAKLRAKLITDESLFMTKQDSEYFRLRAKLFNCMWDDDFETALELLAMGVPPTFTASSGSPLFHAIKKRKLSLARLMLKHPHIKSVINYSATTWAPFPAALVLGEVEIAQAILEHPDLDVSNVHWQFNQYVIGGRHPECMAKSRESMIQLVQLYFEKRAERGYLTPTFTEFKRSCAITCKCTIS
jgi:hypothetical protein